MMTITESMLRAGADLGAVRARWALIGGMAVSIRAEPRFTQDVDFAVAVADDSEADGVVYRLRSRGYQPGVVLEQTYTDRTRTVRLVCSGSRTIVDLLFASSGIEREIVSAATRVEVADGIRVPVATTGHLIAMKTLAGRDRDRLDLSSLIEAASAADLKQAREAVRLIKSRGFSRGQDVAADLEQYIKNAGR